MVVVPTFSPEAKPNDPVALLIVAMPEADELHMADEVTSCVLLSL